MNEFQWQAPWGPNELVYLRGIRGGGTSLILSVLAQTQGDRGQEEEVAVNTMVQEKDISHPTDVKLACKIIGCCWKLSDENEVKLHRRYVKEVKRYLTAQWFRRKPVQRRAARKAQKNLKGLAKRMVRKV